MSQAVGYASQGKPWWARSKSTKDATGLRTKLSSSNLAEDSENYSSAASQRSTKSKDSAAGSKFNTLASAIGIRSKKLPTLAIQDPPLLPPVHRAASQVSAPSAFYTNRPPANSVSSTARSSSYEADEASDSFHAMSEPRTPSDHPRDRMSYQNSVLTFSEMDPFAAGGVIIQQASHDQHRHSGLSDSSLLEPHFKARDVIPVNRVSYASSSSQSQTHLSEPYSPNLVSSRSLLSERLPSDVWGRDELGSLSAHGAYPVQDARARLKTPSGSNSTCSTVAQTDVRNRLSEPSNSVRVAHARPRGMTVAVGGTSQEHNIPSLELRRKASEPLGFHASARQIPVSSSPVTFVSPSATLPPEASSSTSATRPLVVVRKASSTRVQMPPPSRAPPSADLPPPPSSPLTSAEHISLDDISSMFLSDPPSPSSSRLSLTPSADLVIEPGNSMAQSLMGFPKPPTDRWHPVSQGYRTDAMPGPSAGFRHGDFRNASTSRLSSSSSLAQSMQAGGYEHSSYRSPLRSLKKLPSQQSLSGRRQSSQSASSSSIAFADVESGAHGRGHLPAPSKAPRKQRSFQQSRLPLPPLPILRHSASGNTSQGVPPDTRMSSMSSPSSPSREHRKNYFTNGPPTTRKRLFSGSSIRRSTSAHGPGSPLVSAEDDVHSVLSIEELSSRPPSSGVQKVTMTFGTLGSPLSLMTHNACVSPTSYWNESADAPAEPQDERISMSDYTPQHIIPPSDMLKLEEQLEKEAAAQRELEAEVERKPKLELQPGDFGFTFIGRRPRVDSKGSRTRTDSMMSSGSAGTLAFGTPGEDRQLSEEVAPGVSSPTRHVLTNRSLTVGVGSASKHPAPVAGNSWLPTRTGSLQAKPPQKPLPLSIRPSTAQPDIPSPASPTFSSYQQLSPERPPISLPPPPRRPQREDKPTREDGYNKRASIVPLQPLSPPPQRNRTSSAASRPGTANFHAVTAAPSQLRTLSVPPSAFDMDRSMKRRSIMKKPSFLDIEDEFEASENFPDVDIDAPPTSPLDSSFLDMDRGRDSFDTIGSAETSYYR